MKLLLLFMAFAHSIGMACSWKEGNELLVIGVLSFEAFIVFMIIINKEWIQK